MAIEVDLYRSDDYTPEERIELIPVLKAAFEPLLGVPLDRAHFRLSFLPMAQETRLEGDPVLVNLRRGHGFVNVRIALDGRVLYQHPHSVLEVVARPLQRLLAEREPAEHHWGFAIVGPGFDELAFVRPAPRLERSMELGGSDTRVRMFHTEEVREPDPAPATAAQLGAPAARPDDTQVTVILRPSVHEALMRDMPFSEGVEEGGFLTGHVHGDARHPGRFLVEVTAALRAERTGASLLHFTFTGESFMRIGDEIERRGRSEMLVGWYHSHLFPASDALGLSSIDVDLHTGTFLRPWQVAGLVNLTATDRMVRFYARSDDRMVQVPIWVSDS